MKFQAIEIFFLCDNLSKKEKKIFQLFKNFASRCLPKKIFLSSNKLKKKIYYLYRITYSPSKKFICSTVVSESGLSSENTTNKKYYCGYRGTYFRPCDDVSYWSSSKIIQNLKKNSEQNCFQKKILGIFLFEKDALEAEIYYHHFFDVKNHPKFLNQANQTSQKFCYDNTGRVQSFESNRKCSEKLKGKTVRVSTRNKIRLAQLAR